MIDVGTSCAFSERELLLLVASRFSCDRSAARIGHLERHPQRMDAGQLGQCTGQLGDGEHLHFAEDRWLQSTRVSRTYVKRDLAGSYFRDTIVQNSLYFAGQTPFAGREHRTRGTT
jgi:hypothetical protein